MIKLEKLTSGPIFNISGKSTDPSELKVSVKCQKCQNQIKPAMSVAERSDRETTCLPDGCTRQDLEYFAPESTCKILMLLFFKCKYLFERKSGVVGAELERPMVTSLVSFIVLSGLV